LLVGKSERSIGSIQICDKAGNGNIGKSKFFILKGLIVDGVDGSMNLLLDGFADGVVLELEFVEEMVVLVIAGSYLGASSGGSVCRLGSRVIRLVEWLSSADDVGGCRHGEAEATILAVTLFGMDGPCVGIHLFT
jgi:hypothetical protein